MFRNPARRASAISRVAVRPCLSMFHARLGSAPIVTPIVSTFQWWQGQGGLNGTRGSALGGGRWELGAGSCELGAGSCELGAGSWKLLVVQRFDGIQVGGAG